MKDDGFADENVGWTCLPSMPNSLKDLNLMLISYMSSIMTKTVFRVSDHIRTNWAVHCIAAIRKINGLNFIFGK